MFYNLVIFAPIFDKFTIISHVVILNTLSYSHGVTTHIRHTPLKLIPGIRVFGNFITGLVDMEQFSGVLVSHPFRRNTGNYVPIIHKTVHFMRFIERPSPFVISDPRTPVIVTDTTLDSGCGNSTHGTAQRVTTRINSGFVLSF